MHANVHRRPVRHELESLAALRIAAKTTQDMLAGSDETMLRCQAMLERLSRKAGAQRR